MSNTIASLKIKYLSVKGKRCINPKCKSTYLGNPTDLEEDRNLNLCEEVICHSCGSSWVNIYTLTNVTDIKIKNNNSNYKR